MLALRWRQCLVGAAWLRRPPLLVEEEVRLDEFPMPARHVPRREHPAQIVDVGVTLDWLAPIRQDVSMDVVRKVDVPHPGRVRTGVAVVAELREPADSEEPSIRQEEEIVLRESVHRLPVLDDPSQGRVGLFPRASYFRLDDGEVSVLHFSEDLLDVDDLRLPVLQRLEHALDEVTAELRPED